MDQTLANRIIDMLSKLEDIRVALVAAAEKSHEGLAKTAHPDPAVRAAGSAQYQSHKFERNRLEADLENLNRNIRQAITHL